MKTLNDFTKEWDKIKKQLAVVSGETLKLAKKGEKEALRLSKEGKLLFDETTLEVKKERLYYLIGKEYAKIKFGGNHTAKLKNLIAEFDATNKKQKSLKRNKTKARRTKSK